MGEKIALFGVAETMLQTVYARAKESRGRGAIRDAKAEELMAGLITILLLPTGTRRCTTA